MKRTIWAAAAAALVLTAGLAVAAFFGESVETGGWGLSFREGQAPQGPVSAEKLAQLDAAYLDPEGGKVLYLTFDCGYENGYTGKILDILEKKQVKAAFFLTGDYLKRNADLVRRMRAEGHILGNHTMTHPDLGKLDADGLARELAGPEELCREATGTDLDKFLRPPQGLYSEQALETAKSLGYQTVFWSMAYVDWKNDAQPSREQALKTLQSRTHDGAVILLHATSKTNGEILEELLTMWQEQGYRFATLEELFSNA